ncbi:MAG: HEPN domain-containing protein [Terriglobia bacterium]
MKEKADLVRGWLRKAASDVVSLEATLAAGALDGACFHAQQAAEKFLKGFLTFHDRSFPHTHNLTELIELCASLDPAFRALAQGATELTPFAVRLRYDEDFWPPLETARQARTSALKIRDLVLSRLPDAFVKPVE